MRAHLFTTFGALNTGMKILNNENVKIDRITGHGGIFKTKGVAQKILAAAVQAPVSVMETAGEGGAWGIALLASYMKNRAEGENLEEYLDKNVFTGDAGTEEEPDPADVAGYEKFMERYTEGLAIERAAVDHLLQ